MPVSEDVSEEIEVDREVGVLEFLVEGLRSGLGIVLEGFVDTVLQEQVVGHGEFVLRGRLGLVFQYLHETVVLLVETIVENLPGLAERMGTGIDERLVLKVLVGAARHRVDVQERALQPKSGTLYHVGVGQVLTHAG